MDTAVIYSKRTFILVLLIAGFSCQQKPTALDAAVEEVYQKAISNHRTKRDSLDYFFHQCQQYDTLLLSDLSRAQISHIKGLMYESQLKYDSASACFLYGASLLPNDTLKVKLLLRAACDVARISNFEAYRKVMDEAGGLVKQLDDPLQNAAFWGAKGDYSVEIEDFKQAVLCYSQADSILEKNGILRVRDYYQNRIGLAYRKLSKFPLAYEALLKGIELSKLNNNMPRLVTGYNELSRMYRSAQRYDEALKWENKQLSLAYDLNDKSQIREGLEHKGIIYTEKNEYDLAEDYFTEALEIAYDINEPSSIGNGLANLGNFYYRKGDMTKAIDYYNRSYSYRKAHRNRDIAILNSLYHLGDAYLAVKDRELGEYYLTKAVQLADSTQEISWAVTVSKRLVDLYRSTNDDEKYAKALQHYIDVKDRWNKVKENTKFSQLSVQYETRQKETTIALQQEQLKTRKQLLILLANALIIVILIISAVLVNKKIRGRALRAIYKQQLLVNDQRKVISSLLKKTVSFKPDQSENKMLFDLLTLLEDQHIYQNPDLSLEMLAQEMGTNTTYVSQLINKEFDCNFKTLVNRYRINYCKEQIKVNSGNLAMKNVGLMAGFKSQSTFYAIFKAEVGMTPLQFTKVSQMDKELKVG
jgi:AraC-like DNA-binding protein